MIKLGISLAVMALMICAAVAVAVPIPSVPSGADRTAVHFVDADSGRGRVQWMSGNEAGAIAAGDVFVKVNGPDCEERPRAFEVTGRLRAFSKQPHDPACDQQAERCVDGCDGIRWSGAWLTREIAPPGWWGATK